MEGQLGEVGPAADRVWCSARITHQINTRVDQRPADFTADFTGDFSDQKPCSRPAKRRYDRAGLEHVLGLVASHEGVRAEGPEASLAPS